MRPPLYHALFAVTLCVVAATGYWVWYGTIEEKSTQVAALESQLVANARTESRIAAAKASLAQIAGYESTIQNYFVPEANVPVFNDMLEGIGKAQKAEVKVLSVAKSGPHLTLSLSITGTFDAVMRTIGVIEYAPYALVISGLSLQGDDKKVWSANVSILVESVSTPVATSTP